MDADRLKTIKIFADLDDESREAIAKLAAEVSVPDGKELVREGDYSYDLIAIEDLQVAGMTRSAKGTAARPAINVAAKSGLNRSILDAGWGILERMLAYKAEDAGRSVLFVSPNSTSQMCSGCGQVRKKSLAERWHSCECGTELDRDHNAAINILRLGRSQQNVAVL